MKSGVRRPAASAALMSGGQPSLRQRQTLINCHADAPDHKLLNISCPLYPVQSAPKFLV